MTVKITQLKHFDISEFDCKETGANDMDVDFLIKLDMLREACGFAFIIISGYRSVLHSKEVKKRKRAEKKGLTYVRGVHPRGVGADVKYTGGNQLGLIVKYASILGFTGIGIYRHHVHLDMRTALPSVIMWWGRYK